MYKILLFSMLLIHCVTVLHGQIQSNGFLKGTITDQNGSVIPGALVQIENLSTKKTDRLVTNDVGEFELPTMTGIYRITASKIGFCPQRRSGFDVGKEEIVTINMSLLVCSIDSVLMVGDKKEASAMEDRYHVPFKRESVGAGTEGNFGDVQIQYGEKTVLRNHTLYGPIRLNDKSTAPVRLTYNKLQVYASSFKVFSKNLFMAEGNVIFENGVDRVEFSKVVFLLEGGTYEILCTRPISKDDKTVR